MNGRSVNRPKNDPVTKCKKCGELIVWTTTCNGKKMPCDVTPNPTGMFFLFRRRGRIDAVRHTSNEDCALRAIQRAQNLHDCHFETCTPK